MPKLLIVDDEEAICWGLKRVVEKLGHEAETASTAEEAIELARTASFDAVVLDVRLPGMSGLEAIAHLREHLGKAPIIIITAYGDLETAVEAVRRGAFEYVIKPFNAEKARQVIGNALSQVAASNDTDAGGREPPAVGGFVGETPEMQQVYKRIALAAAANASVLLTGESGTGKELAARAIHNYSDRASRPFVAANIAALSETLAESELFGHAKGAFTGADQERNGLLHKANGGTLFLDEVADIPLPTQTKLLRTIEDGQVYAVGADEPFHTDLRIISATHRDLEALVREGKFRHDLYYRISTFEIHLPPLRARRDDIARLAAHFAHLFSADQPFGPTSLSDEVTTELMNREWRGNVRELRNAIEHAVVLARGRDLRVEHLPDSVADITPQTVDELVANIQQLLRRWTRNRLQENAESADLHDQLLNLVEPTVFETVLAQHDGQVAAAARILGLHRTTLAKRIEKTK